MNALQVNRTIDDFYGDEVTKTPPSYLPTFDAWNQGNTCDGCIIDPATADIKQIFNGTWHDSTWHVGDPERVISMNFTGIAVYAFVLLVNGGHEDRTTFTNLTFRIDGELAGSFTHSADSTTNILYNVPAFGRTELPSAPHVFEIHVSGSSDALVLFDYAVYTAVENNQISTSTSSTTSTTTLSANPAPSETPTMTSSKNKLPTIIGGAVGGTTFVIVAVILFRIFLWRRLASRRSTVNTLAIYPHVDPSPYHAAPMLQSLPGNGQNSYHDLAALPVTSIEDTTLLDGHINTLEAQLRALTAPRKPHRPSSSTSHRTPPETPRLGIIRHPVTVSQEYDQWVVPWQHLMTRPPAGDHAASVPSARDSCAPRADTEATATSMEEPSAMEVERMRTELASLRIALACRDADQRAVNADEPLPTYSEQ